MSERKVFPIIFFISIPIVYLLHIPLHQVTPFAALVMGACMLKALVTCFRVFKNSKGYGSAWFTIRSLFRIAEVCWWTCAALSLLYYLFESTAIWLLSLAALFSVAAYLCGFIHQRLPE